MPKKKQLATVTVPNVELVRVGTWNASTGRVTIDRSDLDSMVAAAGDGETDRAPVKLGHVEEPDKGYPSLGWVENLRVEQRSPGEGKPDVDVLVGDLVGVPAALAEIMPSAYRRRSVEIDWGVTTASGDKHRAVLAGLALLGEEAPAVKGLADVLPLFEVPERTAAAGNADAESRDRVEFADGPEDSAEEDRLREIRWAVQSVVRGLIEVAMQTGNPAKIPDLLETVAEPLRSLLPQGMRDMLSSMGQTSTDEPAAGGDDKDQTMRYGAATKRLLGLAEDATDEQVETTLSERGGRDALQEALDATDGDDGDGDGDDDENDDGSGDEPPSALSASTLSELREAGLTVVDSDTVARLQEGAQAGLEARTAQQAEQIDRAITSALSDGRLRPTDEKKWRSRLERDFATFSEVLAEQPVVVPLGERGVEDTGGAGPTGDEFAEGDEAYPSDWLPEVTQQTAGD